MVNFTPCWHLMTYSGREHTIFILFQSSDDDGKKRKQQKQKIESPGSPLSLYWEKTGIKKFMFWWVDDYW